jgi:hypothetical protein
VRRQLLGHPLTGNEQQGGTRSAARARRVQSGRRRSCGSLKLKTISGALAASKDGRIHCVLGTCYCHPGRNEEMERAFAVFNRQHHEVKEENSAATSLK